MMVIITTLEQSISLKGLRIFASHNIYFDKVWYTHQSVETEIPLRCIIYSYIYIYIFIVIYIVIVLILVGKFLKEISYFLGRVLELL